MPWPRRLLNFPIILFAIMQQSFVGLSILFDGSARNATSVHVLDMLLPRGGEPFLLFLAAGLAALGFWCRKRVDNVLMLMPQQLLLYMSAGGAAEAILTGHFADGVIRSRAFLLADQCPMVLIAIFHTWAMMLILRHGEERKD